MTLLVTIFLVLINIHNTIQTNSPKVDSKKVSWITKYILYLRTTNFFKAEGLTAIECWVIACIIFVFGALLEYTVILLKLKLKKVRNCSKQQNGSTITSAITKPECADLMPKNGKPATRKKSSSQGKTTFISNKNVQNFIFYSSLNPILQWKSAIVWKMIEINHIFVLAK